MIRLPLASSLLALPVACGDGQPMGRSNYAIVFGDYLTTGKSLNLVVYRGL